MTPPTIHPIREVRNIFITGWTYADFQKYAEYEGMFADSFTSHDGGTQFILTRENQQGYSGFPVEVTTTITLINPAT